jgi:hypothetical protein
MVAMAGCIQSQSQSVQPAAVQLPAQGLVLPKAPVVLGEIKGSVVASNAGQVPTPTSMDEKTIEVPESGILWVRFNMTWNAGAPVSDLDLFIFDANGKFVGAGTSSDPAIETVTIRLTGQQALGTWTTRASNAVGPPADYTIVVDAMQAEVVA